MRKILAGFLATSMIVSMATMASAATEVAATASFTVNQNFAVSNTYTTTGSGTVTPTGNTDWTATVKIEKVTVDFLKSDGSSLGTAVFAINKDVTQSYTGGVTVTAGVAPTVDTVAFLPISPAAPEVYKALDGAIVSDVKLGDAHYTLKLVNKSGTNVSIDFGGHALPNLNSVSVTGTASVVSATSTVKDNNVAIPMAPTMMQQATFTSGTVTPGTPNETIETEKDGDMANMPVSKILVCYPDGTPIPLTEEGNGADKNLNDNGGVQSGKTVYFMLRDDTGAAFDRFEDDLYWGVKVTKSNNGKYVKAITDTTKNFSNDLYDANKTNVTVPGTGGGRHRYLKVELNEIYTDDEYKIGLDLRLQAKSKAVDTGIVTKDETEIKVRDFTFWMKNIVKSADSEWRVGIGGLMLNPVTNDWNEVTYFNESNDVAFMKFFGDSDTGKFYAKLSTKWEHADYAAYFNDQDSFFFEFTGSPKLSSTSRADLQIYDPFVDENGDSTFDASTATIYQVIDGDLVDVTDSFTYGEGENGDNAYITRTRFLGTYIICEKPVEEASNDDIVDDLMPDDLEVPTETPITPTVPDAGVKQPANTGRYA